MKKENILKFIKRILIFSAILGVFLYLYKVYLNVENKKEYDVSRIGYTQYGTGSPTLANTNNVCDMIENVKSTVVGISKLRSIGNSIFSQSSNEIELGIGTGLIVTSDGYILSNTHVTGEMGSSCYVTLETGKSYDGTVVWADKNLDLSITKIEITNFPYAKLGNSSEIRVGENVYAIGNPIGFEFRQTVTSGIISAVNRTLKITEEDMSSYMTNLIQTDATINPGNSGGPLLTEDGTVIGINTVKISSAEGIGFAIPINIVKPIIESFKETGSFSEVYIGISGYDANVIPYLDKNITSFSKGIYIIDINKDSPASQTDLKQGDIINSIDGISIITMNDLRSYIYTKEPGDEIVLNISRGKVNRDITMILKEKPVK